MSDKLKKIDENDIAELFKGLKSKSSMDDSGFSLWWDKRKSRNFAELERNISDAFNARVSSIQSFLQIALQLYTWDDRVDYEKHLYDHHKTMNLIAQKREILALLKAEMENWMLKEEVDLAHLDNQLKKAVLAKALPKHNDDEEEEEPDNTEWYMGYQVG